MRRQLRAASSRYDWAHHDARFLQCLQEIRCASCT
jgi:hypothetical protein